MFCPTCSKEASSDQKFCRLCGMDLQGVSKLIVGQSALKIIERRADEPDEHTQAKRDRLMRLGFTALMSSFVVGSLILVLAGLDKYYPGVADFIPFVLGIAGMILFVGIFTMTYSTLLPKVSRTRNPSTPKADTRAESPASEPPPAFLNLYRASRTPRQNCSRFLLQRPLRAIPRHSERSTYGSRN
jgi:hypothetical protein